MVLAVPPGYYNQETQHGSTKSWQYVMTTKTAQIVGENNRRVSLVFLNTSNGTIFIGSLEDIEAGNGFALAAGVPMMFFTNTALWAQGKAGGETATAIEEYLT